MKKPALQIFEEHIAASRFRGQRVFGTQLDNTIKIDPRQNEEERLDTLLHELLHFLNPDAKECEVVEAAAVLSTTLWKYGYRRALL